MPPKLSSRISLFEKSLFETPSQKKARKEAERAEEERKAAAKAKKSAAAQKSAAKLAAEAAAFTGKSISSLAAAGGNAPAPAPVEPHLEVIYIGGNQYYIERAFNPNSNGMVYTILEDKSVGPYIGDLTSHRNRSNSTNSTRAINNRGGSNINRLMSRLDLSSPNRRYRPYANNSIKSYPESALKLRELSSEELAQREGIIPPKGGGGGGGGAGGGNNNPSRTRKNRKHRRRTYRKHN